MEGEHFEMGEGWVVLRRTILSNQFIKVSGNMIWALKIAATKTLRRK